MAKILVVEDNSDYRELLQNFLESANYEVHTAADGIAALELINRPFFFDLVLLDLMLPKLDGFRICKAIREICDTPVIMLTALDSEDSQLRGYHLQIDDYITKPVSMPLLLHKVEAVLRRTMLPATDATQKSALQAVTSATEKKAFKTAITTLHFEQISLDLMAYTVCVAGVPVDFTLREFEILQELMQTPGIVVTRKALISKLWGYDFYGDSRIVDTHIKNIRKKLGAYDCIETVRGVGYKLTAKRGGYK